MPLNLMFLAGEDSGDQHAARVLRELKVLAPGTTFFGYGGQRMQKEGMELLFNLAQDLPVIGISQVLANYPKLRRLLTSAGKLLEERRPDALVLVDYPGFNLRLAAKARQLGIPVVYYISPQVWAWHQSRLKVIAKNVDHMLVILPFEQEIFRRAGVAATYVGHPLCDDTEEIAPRQQTLEALGLSPDSLLIGLIPGSRRGEIERHLPVLLEAARLIRLDLPGARFVLPKAATIERAALEERLREFPELGVVVAEERLKSVRAAMDFAICKSGTSTLELGMLGIPMVIIYRVSMVTLAVAKVVLKIRHIGLVNIVAGREIVPELLQDRATPGEIARETLDILKSPARLETIRSGLREVRKLLGGPGASHRAAEIIVQVAQTRKPGTQAPTR